MGRGAGVCSRQLEGKGNGKAVIRLERVDTGTEKVHE